MKDKIIGSIGSNIDDCIEDSLAKLLKLNPGRHQIALNILISSYP